MAELPSDLVTPKEAAARVGAHTGTVRGWVRRGRLRGWRRAGERIYVSLSEAMQLFQEIKPDAPRTRREVSDAVAKALEQIERDGAA